MSIYKHYLNGKIVEEKDLLISPRDLGYSRGYGIFEYIRTYSSRPFKLEEHVGRLLSSADLIKLKHNFSFEQIKKIILDIVEINNDGKEKSIRIHLSGGVSNSMYQTSEATILVFIDPFTEKDPSIYTDGVVLNSVKYEREIPRAKNVNYIEGIIQAHENRKNGFYEPLYYSDEQVYETSNSNIFAVKNNVLYTPKNNVFCGTVRNTIINDLNDSFEIKEKDFDLNFLLSADEAFLASGGKQIAPVIRIDKEIIGNGKVGKVTIHVLEKFREFVNSENW